MSYVNPSLPTVTLPIGIERAIDDLRGMLEVNLPWLSFAFGRAFAFNEKESKIPKCYVGNGEYINVLPNDALFREQTAASLFFQLRGPETYLTFNYKQGSVRQATVGIIFWCNLKLIDSSKGYIFTEELKNDVEQIIQSNPYVKEIVEWVDERAEDVFDRYTLPQTSQYLMYPYSGFRVNVNLAYDEACSSNPLTDYEGNENLPAMDDIDFIVGQEADADVEVNVINSSTREIPSIAGRKIRLFRGTVKQSKTINLNGYSYSYNPTTGRISVTPDYRAEELISVEII